MPTAEQLQALAKKSPDTLASAFCKSLRGSYPSVTPAECKAHIEASLRGEAPKGIIAMFIDGWMKDGTN